MNETRRELLQVLAEILELMPDFRFGQLVVNMANYAVEEPRDYTWDCEDEDMLQHAKSFLESQRRRLGVEVPPATKVPA
jgi:hypothetical protein